MPLALAIAHGWPWRGHVPGPHGRPGGYPVLWDGAALRLDLPPGLTEEAAVAWNARFESDNGLVVEGRHARYKGRLFDALHAVAPSLAAGFPIDHLGSVLSEMEALRTRLQSA